MANRTYLADNNSTTWRQAYTKIATRGDFVIQQDNAYYSDTFAQTYYWSGNTATTSDCSATYCNLYPDETVAFIYDSNSNLYSPMESYKAYLEETTGLTLTVRPMSTKEAVTIISNSWAYNQSYWLGCSYSKYTDFVFYVLSNNTDHISHGEFRDTNIGIRPVIEISLDNFE